MMMIVSRNEVKHMTPEERLRHYEEEKNELFYSIKNMTAKEVIAAHESLREKWQV